MTNDSKRILECDLGQSMGGPLRPIFLLELHNVDVEKVVAAEAVVKHLFDVVVKALAIPWAHDQRFNVAEEHVVKIIPGIHPTGWIDYMGALFVRLFCSAHIAFGSQATCKKISFTKMNWIWLKWALFGSRSN